MSDLFFFVIDSSTKSSTRFWNTPKLINTFDFQLIIWLEKQYVINIPKLHNLIVLSHEPLMNFVFSALTAMQSTLSVCPTHFSAPSTLSPWRFQSHTITDWSCEALTNLHDESSADNQATAFTAPLCPSNFLTSCPLVLQIWIELSYEPSRIL